MTDNNRSGNMADIADTGLWRLEATLSRYNACAALRVIGHPEIPPRSLLDTEWEADEEGLLQRIENAVYDHPQVLDDYAAVITIDTPSITWAPLLHAPHDEEREKIFTTIYGGEASDVMADELYTDDIHSTEETNPYDSPDEIPVALYSLAPGLKAFLARTFPGARIFSHQTPLVRRALSMMREHGGVLVVLRLHSTDIVAAESGRLLCAVTHPHDVQGMPPEDVAYHIFNTASTFGLDIATQMIYLGGISERVAQVQQTLRPFSSSVVILSDGELRHNAPGLLVR